MKYTSEVNAIQVAIIHRLFTNDKLRFSEINTQGFPSDQFSYHLRQLIKWGLVDKTADNHYQLSVKGRGRALLIDTASGVYIEQGFVACRMFLSRQHQGVTQYLMQKRTRVPYQGYLGEPGGKVLFGEDVAAAAVRNMMAETGLHCSMSVRGLVHFKDVYQGQIVQDKFFFIVKATQPQGELLEEGTTGENAWFSYEEIMAYPRTYQSVAKMIALAEGKSFGFLEETYEVEEY